MTRHQALGENRVDGLGQNGKDEGGMNYGMDYGHLDRDQIPEDAEMGTDDIAIRVPVERLRVGCPFGL